MASRQAKRDDLKARLIAAARERIESQGVRNLRARDITQDAGCALGGLYTAFSDLQTLIIHVNGETLNALSGHLSKAREGTNGPRDELRALALAYLDFAETHRALWFALFDATSLADTPIPDWHRAQQADLVRLIAEPLSRIETTLAQEALVNRAQALFAAVHGIVTISLEERAIGLSGQALRDELILLLDRMIAIRDA
ncbi:TetR-like C-terminal domain-containing protein [Fulvimarina sp. MAC8]|uniref:TetR/AcrR family transcriptional regulator n=1 Tax=Fulvimarina sp. MAC8 TaxID=3162874 RepID=UPI0032EC973C